MRGNLDEDKLFAIIEDKISLSSQAYDTEIKKQKWSKDKANVLQILTF